MFSLIWMAGFYVVGASVDRISWRWVAAVLVAAALDVAYRFYLRVEQAQAEGFDFAWPPHKMIGTWLVLSVFACVFFALGRWKNSARRRRRRQLGLE